LLLKLLIESLKLYLLLQYIRKKLIKGKKNLNRFKEVKGRKLINKRQKKMIKFKVTKCSNN